MLHTSMLEEIYEASMEAWLYTHHDINTEEDDSPPMQCDLCFKEATILYNIPGENGVEMLICYNCYVSMWGKWRES